MENDYWKDVKYRGPHHPIIKAFVTPKLDFIKKYVHLEYPASILDLGCGNGVFTYYLSKIGSTVGLDVSRTMLKKNPHNLLVQSNASDTPFRNDQFNVVFEANLLHHVDRPLKVLKEMKRTSSKYVITIEPNMWNPLMLLNCLIVKHERGALKFTQKHLKHLLSEISLKIITQVSMGAIFQNKTPTFLLPYLKKLDRIFFWGGYILFITEK